MLQAILFSRACESGRLVLMETPSDYQLAVRWFGLTIQLASVTKKELVDQRRSRIGVVS